MTCEVMPGGRCDALDTCANGLPCVPAVDGKSAFCCTSTCNATCDLLTVCESSGTTCSDLCPMSSGACRSPCDASGACLIAPLGKPCAVSGKANGTGYCDGTDATTCTMFGMPGSTCLFDAECGVDYALSNNTALSADDADDALCLGNVCCQSSVTNCTRLSGAECRTGTCVPLGRSAPGSCDVSNPQTCTSLPAYV